LTVGYSDTPKIVRVMFDDPDDEQHGLEVRMRGLSTGELLDVMDLAELTEESGRTTEGRAQIRRLFETIAGALVSWNLETADGEPVPADLAGVRGRDFGRNLALFGAWIRGLTQVAGPLVSRSVSGPPPEMPMEALHRVS
jgi:hypothetical protein